MSESFTGPPARRLIQQVGLIQMDKGPLIVLDNACGTGVVSSLLYEMLDENDKEKLQLSCGDFSEAMVQSVQQRIIESEWKGAKAQVVDAQV
jgi:ubiquinone/menaquinone biosynthesis C-methylase UbiE